MHLTLRYGRESQVELDLTSTALVADCGSPRGMPLLDPASAVDAALLEPISFPALSQATVPGDKVAVPIEQGVPQSGEVAAAVVRSLARSGVQPADITVLRTREDEAGDPRQWLPGELRDQVACRAHDPEDRCQLGFLGNTKGGQPIYLSRQICDADLVLPIGCSRLEPPGTALGAGSLYPAFSDAKTQERFRAWELSPQAEPCARGRREVQEVAWQLGVHLTVQVVPGASGRLLHVLAGEAGEVAQAGAALCRKAWSYAVPRRASLVVAAIEGDQSQQTWQNLGRAVAAALCSVADDGAIALCCELTERPGPAVKRLAQADNLQAALRQIRGSRFADALTAARLAEALDRVKLYLLSRLDEELVEDLGVAAVREGREIARLASRHASCILLGNAQYALALPDEN